MPAVVWPRRCRRGVSKRVNDAGCPASRSASELYVNEPSRFDDWSVSDMDCFTSVENDRRCLLFMLTHDNELRNETSAVDCALPSEGLPPACTVRTPELPSSNSELM